MRGLSASACCFLALPLLLQLASAAVLRTRLPSETGPMAVLLFRRPAQQHREPLLVGDASSVLGLDALTDEVGYALKEPAPQMASQSALDGDSMFIRPTKRQVRYHQCYFNPISCFG